MKEKEIQQEYFKLQMLDSQMKELEKNISILEEQVLQLQDLKENIGKINNLKQGSKMHSPISPGIYVESELLNSKNILVNVGANIFIKKDILGAQDTVYERIKYVQKIIQNLVKDLEELSIQSRESQEKLQQYV